jgi:hypothetical protein
LHTVDATSIGSAANRKPEPPRFQAGDTSIASRDLTGDAITSQPIPEAISRC